MFVWPIASRLELLCSSSNGIFGCEAIIWRDSVVLKVQYCNSTPYCAATVPRSITTKGCSTVGSPGEINPA